MSTDNQNPGSELALNDENLEAIRNYFDGLLDSTQQWIAYAANNADNPDAVKESSIVIAESIDTMKQQIALTTNILGKAVRVIAGQTEALNEALEQRDRIAQELDTVKEEMNDKVREAYDEGYGDAESNIDDYVDPWYLNDIVDEEIMEREEALHYEVRTLAQDLRKRGEAQHADELETALNLSDEMEQKARELLSRARSIVHRRPMPTDNDVASDDDQGEMDDVA